MVSEGQNQSMKNHLFQTNQVLSLRKTFKKSNPNLALRFKKSNPHLALRSNDTSYNFRNSHNI